MNINQFWDLITGTNKQGPEATKSVIPYDYSQLYQALYDQYNNDAAIADNDTTRRLRTVVNRSVEFYAAKILPGAKLTVTVKDLPALEEIPQRILTDSAFGNNKPAMLRGFALYGDSFVRVRGEGDRVLLEDVSPFYVTDFGEDTIGKLTYIRIDIPTLDANNNPAQYVEYWDAATQTYRQWLTTLSARTPIKSLGTPQVTASFRSLGVTEIPIVHTKFRDNGDLRGLGCTYHALDKILEANRIATRLHDLFFRFDKPIWAVSANDKDAAGRPLPAPKINTTTGGDATAGEAAKETVFGDLAYLPGMATLNPLIPGVNYADGLAILNAHMQEIEDDLPELRWYSMNAADRAQLSGVAIRAMLGAAVDRANEARNNFLTSLVRMLEIALDIASFNGIISQADRAALAGAFEVTAEDPWAETTADKAATMQALTAAGVPAVAAMKLAGFTQTQVDEAFPNGNTPAPAKMPVTPGKAVIGTAPTSAIRVG